MNRTSYDMAVFLAGCGIGTLGLNLFSSVDIPAKPDKIVFLSDTGSRAPDVTTLGTKGDDHGYSELSFQVVVRGAPGGVADCYDKAFRIRALLHRMHRLCVWPKTYCYTRHISGPFDMPLDGSMRPFISMNFRTIVYYYDFNGYERWLSSNVCNVSSATAILTKDE